MIENLLLPAIATISAGISLILGIWTITDRTPNRLRYQSIITLNVIILVTIILSLIIYKKPPSFPPYKH